MIFVCDQRPLQRDIDAWDLPACVRHAHGLFLSALLATPWTWNKLPADRVAHHWLCCLFINWHVSVKAGGDCGRDFSRLWWNVSAISICGFRNCSHFLIIREREVESINTKTKPDQIVAADLYWKGDNFFFGETPQIRIIPQYISLTESVRRHEDEEAIWIHSRRSPDGYLHILHDPDYMEDFLRKKSISVPPGTCNVHNIKSKPFQQQPSPQISNELVLHMGF